VSTTAKGKNDLSFDELIAVSVGKKLEKKEDKRNEHCIITCPVNGLPIGRDNFVHSP
jgi:hypothetical protein